jgi:hypothetical protein
LFDTKTKRFYYYNLYDQRTSWHKPTSATKLANGEDESHRQQSAVANLLASKILNILVSNYGLDGQLDVLLDEVEFDNKRANGQTTTIDLDALFRQDEIVALIAEARNQQLTNSHHQTVNGGTLNRHRTAATSPSTTTANGNELKKSISMVSSSSSSASLRHQPHNEIRPRPPQPRTNPNYVNMEKLEKNSCGGGTYGRLSEQQVAAAVAASQQATTNMSEEENGLNNSSLSDFRKYFVKTNTKLNGFHSLSSLNNSYFNDLTHATLMLIRLLNKVANENLVINKENAYVGVGCGNNNNNNNNISASSISWSNSTDSPNSTSLSESRNNAGAGVCSINGKYSSNTESRSKCIFKCMKGF